MALKRRSEGETREKGQTIREALTSGTVPSRWTDGWVPCRPAGPAPMVDQSEGGGCMTARSRESAQRESLPGREQGGRVHDKGPGL